MESGALLKAEGDIKQLKNGNRLKKRQRGEKKKGEKKKRDKQNGCSGNQMMLIANMEDKNINRFYSAVPSSFESLTVATTPLQKIISKPRHSGGRFPGRWNRISQKFIVYLIQQQQSPLCWP